MLLTHIKGEILKYEYYIKIYFEAYSLYTDFKKKISRNYLKNFELLIVTQVLPVDACACGLTACVA